MHRLLVYNKYMIINPDKNILATDIQEGMSVADFGSGSGLHIEPLSARVGMKGKVYAIEIQKNLLLSLEKSLKEKNIENVYGIWGDIEKNGGTKLADESIDRVIISNVFFQCQDKLACISEAKRILKKNGKILLIEWNTDSNILGPHKNHKVDEEQAKKLFEMKGLKVDRIISVGEYHYGILFMLS